MSNKLHKLTRNITLKELEEARTRIENNLASIFLCVWINVLHDEGYSEEQLQDLVVKVVDEYNNIENLEDYKNATYEKTGMTIKPE